MRTHLLKTVDPYWTDVSEGAKTFEVRLNDRAYQKGDRLILRRWLAEPKCWDQRQGWKFSNPDDQNYFQLHFEITYVLQGGQFGIEPQYCVLGLKKVSE